MQQKEPLTLVLTANGKTGRRVATRLEARGVPIRRGSRSAAIPFDWEDSTTWARALAGVEAVYVVYTPDLAVRAAPGAIAEFVELARRSGVRRLAGCRSSRGLRGAEHRTRIKARQVPRSWMLLGTLPQRRAGFEDRCLANRDYSDSLLVLLSGRGEEEAQRCERLVQDSGLEWTIVRASWFSQNFSEGAFHELVVGGEVALPAGAVAEPFVDVDDIADVVVAALTEEGHTGQVYEVTGPRLLTFADAVAEIAQATGRDLRYEEISPAAFVAGLEQARVPAEYVQLLRYLFTTVLDGRNAHVANGVERALSRAPRDFREYARNVAASGAWHGAAQGA